MELPSANWAISDAAKTGCASIDMDKTVATAACCKEEDLSSFWALHRTMEDDFTLEDFFALTTTFVPTIEDCATENIVIVLLRFVRA